MADYRIEKIDYRIEKARRRVTVVMSVGERIEGDVFLQPSVRYRTGPEAPLEMLNDHDPFFPLDVAGGAPVLVAKDRVIEVEYASLPADTQSEVEAPGVALELLLTNGTTIQGELHPEVRIERPRVLDYLNAYAGRFILVTRGATTSLVHRAAIVRVRQNP